MQNQRGPLDGFENKKLKTTAYGMAVATLFLHDDIELQKSLVDSRSEIEERLQMFKDLDSTSLKDRLEETEMMHDQVRTLIDVNQKSIDTMKQVIRHHGNLLGGIPLNMGKAIHGDEETLDRASKIVEYHADELWAEATKLNEETARKLQAQQVENKMKSTEPSL